MDANVFEGAGKRGFLDWIDSVNSVNSVQFVEKNLKPFYI
jgi:hypothetical protein